MVTIDGQTLIYSTHFLVQNDKQVVLEIPYQDYIFKTGLLFRKGADGGEPSMSNAVVGNQSNFEFVNWSNSAGTVSVGKNVFAKLPTGDVFFHVTSSYMADQNHVHFYLHAA